MENIEYNQDKGTYSFYSAKQTPWHKKGIVTTEAKTSEEVIKLANLDFDVVKVANMIPLNTAANYAIRDNLNLNMDKYDKLFNKLIPSNISFSNVRVDNWNVLGEVGKNYEVVQNKEMFTFIDDLVGNKEARFETAGCLGKGEVIFMSLKLPDIIRFDNKDDIGENYLLLVSSHDGSRQIDVLFTPVRVVCQNTLNMALSGTSKRRISMKHTRNVRDKLINLRILMGLNREYINDLQSNIDMLAKIQISEYDMNKVIANLVFDNKELDLIKPYNYRVEGVKDITTQKYKEFNRIKAWVEEGVGQNTQQGTGLWLYNGVNGYYNNGKVYKDEDERFESILYGTSDKKMNAAFSNLTLNS